MHATNLIPPGRSSAGRSGSVVPFAARIRQQSGLGQHTSVGTSNGKPVGIAAQRRGGSVFASIPGAEPEPSDLAPSCCLLTQAARFSFDATAGGNRGSACSLRSERGSYRAMAPGGFSIRRATTFAGVLPAPAASVRFGARVALPRRVAPRRRAPFSAAVAAQVTR